MRAAVTVALADSFSHGFLELGRLAYSVDEKRVYLPHKTSLGAVLALLAQGSDSREHLGEHLSAMVTWLSEVMVDEWELWIRGPFAADLNDLEPAGLDVVLFGQPNVPSEWPLRLLAAGPSKLHSGELLLAVIPPTHHDQSYGRDREAIRSSRRCTDQNGDQRETGWISIEGIGGRE